MRGAVREINGAFLKDKCLQEQSRFYLGILQIHSLVINEWDEEKFTTCDD